MAIKKSKSKSKKPESSYHYEMGLRQDAKGKLVLQKELVKDIQKETIFSKKVLIIIGFILLLLVISQVLLIDLILSG